jgi:pantetheine-phosphate adenylyltransferase
MIRAVFPGTFDPIHYGHIDIATRASRLFDELIIAVYDIPLKNLLFTPKDRLQMVSQTFENDAKIKVMGYSGLTVEFCRKIDAQVIVRGLRVFSDFEHEFRMALTNDHLAPRNRSDRSNNQRTAHLFVFLHGARSCITGWKCQCNGTSSRQRRTQARFLELGENQQVVL